MSEHLDFQHEDDCPCFGDEPEHSIDCKNCTCDKTCRLPPDGWSCSRIVGHEGPCAASPAKLWPTPSPVPLGEPAETWERLPEKDCPKCGFALNQHGTGIGIPNDYIPCEYCWLKEENARLNAALASKAVPDDKDAALDWANAEISNLRRDLANAQLKAVPLGEGELPPRPKREHMRQFATALTSYDYLQYAEFVRYADEVERQLLQSQQLNNRRFHQLADMSTRALLAENRLENAEAELSRLRSQHQELQEWWRTHIGDGTSKFSVSELNSLYEDFQLELARLRSQERPEDAWKRAYLLGRSDGWNANADRIYHNINAPFTLPIYTPPAQKEN